MAPLAALTQLHTLELSNNRLQAVVCGSLVSLEELWLNDNLVEEEAHLADLALLPRLQTLYLASSIPPPHPPHPHPPYREAGLAHYLRAPLTPPYISLLSLIHLHTHPYALLVPHPPRTSLRRDRTAVRCPATCVSCSPSHRARSSSSMPTSCRCTDSASSERSRQQSRRQHCWWSSRWWRHRWRRRRSHRRGSERSHKARDASGSLHPPWGKLKRLLIRLAKITIMVLTESKENSKENVPCKQSSKVDVAGQEEYAYHELISRHAHMRLQLEVGGIIGRGSFGTVHTARWRDGRAERSVVVKRVRTVGLAEKAWRQVMREAVLHSQAVHPHICPLVGAYEDRGDVHLVLHACVGDLAGAIAAGMPWLPTAAPWVLRSVLLALRCLHAEPLETVHSDVKPANLLLDGRGVWMLADLGAASRCHANGLLGRCTLVGSPAYRAPEVVAIDHLGLGLSGARYSFPADLWSCGVLLFEVLSAGGLPFPAERDAAAQPAAIVFGTPPLDAIGGGGARRLLQQLLVKQPYMRSTAEEALSSGYVQEAKPPSPTEANDWASGYSSLGLHELQPLSELEPEPEWCPTPRKPSAQGPSAEDSGSAAC
jgi:serine/threonine protein kinase